MSKDLKTKASPTVDREIEALVRTAPRIHRVMGQYFEQIPLDVDQLHPSHFRALVVLSERKQPATVTDLAHDLGVSAGTASTTAKTLLRAGCILKRRSQKDDRVVLLELSAKGADCVASQERRLQQVFEKLLSQLSPSQRRAFLKAHQTIATLLEEIASS